MTILDGTGTRLRDCREIPSVRQTYVGALDHLDGIVRVVIAKAVDTKAVPRKIAECFHQKNLIMRITEFDEAKGEFRAVAVENPRI